MTTHQDKPLPLKEVVDGVKRKARGYYGYPRPLERVDKDSK
jgi:hypothetical protein